MKDITWTSLDDQNARKEGWCLSTDQNEDYTLQRVDEMDRFENDEAAWAYVRHQGRLLHNKALLILQSENGMHYDEIMEADRSEKEIDAFIELIEVEKVLERCLAENERDTQDWVREKMFKDREWLFEALENELITLVMPPVEKESTFAEDCRNAINEIVEKKGVKFLFDLLEPHTLMAPSL